MLIELHLQRSDEENAKRDAELQAALERFKRKAGLAWTPEEQEEIDSVLGDADAYMRNGRLRLAVQKYDVGLRPAHPLLA